MKIARSALHIFLWTMIITHMGFSFLNEKEMSMLSDLVSKLEIRFCIFLTDTTNIYYTKQMSVLNLPSTQLNISPLIRNLQKFVAHANVFSTVVVFKERELNVLEEVTHLLGNYTKSYLMSRFTWFAFLDNPKESIFRYDFRVPLTCEFILIQPVDDHLNRYKLTEIYQVKNKSFSYDFGTWSGFLNATNISFIERRSDLNGNTIKTLSEELFSQGCLKYKTQPCQFITLLNDFSNMMNFKIHATTVQLFKNNSAFDKNAVSKLDSLFLRDKSLDVAIHPASFHRNGYLGQYRIGPFYLQTTHWAIKYPSAKLRQDYYIQPFETYIWLGIISNLVIGSTFTLLLQKVYKQKKRCLVDDVFLVFELFCNQNGNEEIKNISLRIVCLFMTVVGMYLTNSFGAVITAFLSVEIPEIPFNNFNEFLDNGQYVLATAGDTLARRLKASEELQKQNDLTHYQIAVYSQPVFHRFKSEIVCNNKSLAITFIDDEDFENYPCRIYRIPKPIIVIHGILGLQIPSPFPKLFNYNLLKFFESGIQKKIQENMYRKSRRITDSNDFGSDFRPVELYQMLQVLSMPLIGILLASVIFVGEMLYKLRVCKGKIAFSSFKLSFSSD